MGQILIKSTRIIFSSYECPSLIPKTCLMFPMFSCFGSLAAYLFSCNFTFPSKVKTVCQMQHFKYYATLTHFITLNVFILLLRFHCHLMLNTAWCFTQGSYRILEMKFHYFSMIFHNKSEVSHKKSFHFQFQ